MKEKTKIKMNKEFIPYEQALELKELGFDEPCFGYYRTYGSNKFYLGWMLRPIPSRYKIIKAPTIQQVFKWFRKTYSFYCVLEKYQFDDWSYKISKIEKNSTVNSKSVDGFTTYEEAELACLKKLIEIVKTN
jgi:hypothetical protein